MHKEDQADDLAHRIEETLIAREKERMDILAIHPQTDIEPPKKCRKGVSFALLGLGFLLGGLIGALCYVLLPAPQATASLSPTTRPASNLLIEADRLLAAGQKEAARSTYFDALRQYPDSVVAHNNLAVLFAAEGDLVQAREQLNQALKTSPAYEAVHENMSRIYASMARNSYGKALQLQEETAPVRLKALGDAAQLSVVVTPVNAPATLPVPEKTLAINAPAGEPLAVPSAPLVDPVSPAVAPDPTAGSQPDVVALNSPANQIVLAKLEKNDMRPATPVSDPSACPTPQQFLDLWASAWSKQNVKKYLSFYAPNYFSERSPSRASWEDQRRERLTKPGFIEVELNDFVVKVESDQRVEVQMVQSYKSDNYQDKTRKLMRLERRDSSWQIADERTLERLN